MKKSVFNLKILMCICLGFLVLNQESFAGSVIQFPNSFKIRCESVFIQASLNPPTVDSALPKSPMLTAASILELGKPPYPTHVLQSFIHHLTKVKRQLVYGDFLYMGQHGFDQLIEPISQISQISKMLAEDGNSKNGLTEKLQHALEKTFLVFSSPEVQSRLKVAGIKYDSTDMNHSVRFNPLQNSTLAELNHLEVLIQISATMVRDHRDRTLRTPLGSAKLEQSETQSKNFTQARHEHLQLLFQVEQLLEKSNRSLTNLRRLHRLPETDTSLPLFIIRNLRSHVLDTAFFQHLIHEAANSNSRSKRRLASHIQWMIDNLRSQEVILRNRGFSLTSDQPDLAISLMYLRDSVHTIFPEDFGNTLIALQDLSRALQSKGFLKGNEQFGRDENKQTIIKALNGIQTRLNKINTQLYIYNAKLLDQVQSELNQLFENLR